MLGIDTVVKGDLDRVIDVLENDIEIVALDAVGGVAQHEIAVAVFTGDFESGLIIARSAPSGKLFGLEHLVGIEGGDVAEGGRGGEIFGAPERCAPVEVAERAIGAKAHGVGTGAGREKPDFTRLDVLNLGGQAQGGKQAEGGDAVHGARLTHSARGRAVEAERMISPHCPAKTHNEIPKAAVLGGKFGWRSIELPARHATHWAVCSGVPPCRRDGLGGR